jgi:hypothetical protein
LIKSLINFGLFFSWIKSPLWVCIWIFRLHKQYRL